MNEYARKLREIQQTRRQLRKDEEILYRGQQEALAPYLHDTQVTIKITGKKDVPMWYGGGGNLLLAGQTYTLDVGYVRPYPSGLSALCIFWFDETDGTKSCYKLNTNDFEVIKI